MAGAPGYEYSGTSKAWSTVIAAPCSIDSSTAISSAALAASPKSVGTKMFLILTMRRFTRGEYATIEQLPCQPFSRCARKTVDPSRERLFRRQPDLTAHFGRPPKHHERRDAPDIVTRSHT